MSKPEHKNIGEALLAVYKEVGYVQKKGRNQAQSYNYAGEKDFIEALRPAMIENGIIVYPSGVADKQVVEIRKGDKVNINVTATYCFTFVHVSSNTIIQAQVSGEGSDPLDKGSYKAMTGAYKYALRQTFMIETGNDPEKHEEVAEASFKNGAHRKASGEEILAAIEVKSLAELNTVMADYKQDINRFKLGNEQDKEFFDQIVARASELKKTLSQHSQQLNGVSHGV